MAWGTGKRLEEVVLMVSELLTGETMVEDSIVVGLSVDEHSCSSLARAGF